ncbi:hypothetical protein ABZ468_53075 [Streptomyces sp. NPDC005708]|uniref:hypothetical protein n=1 Tax=Streptomyces sp. NPDC005708 TaxID=3154564 RepID=UPI003408B496
MTTPPALLIPPLDRLLAGPIPVQPVTHVPMPTHHQFNWRSEHVGGPPPEAAYYHPKITIHVHGNGIAEQLPPNPVAWTLACAWRGLQLEYPLIGPVLVTGTEGPGGAFTPLPAPLATQTEQVIGKVTPWWLEHAYMVPLWRDYADSRVFTPAIALARQALTP